MKIVLKMLAVSMVVVPFFQLPVSGSAQLLSEEPAQQRLNVVLVLVDDLGWMDLGCQGSDLFETPHLDRLAEQGMRLTNGYAACAVCSPTRAAVQTGRYPGRLFVTDWIRSRFQGGRIPADKINPCLAPIEQWRGKKVLCPPNALWMESSETTIAEVLKSQGYQTCYIGKWHLGTDDWYPQKQGFDFNFGGCDYGQPPSYFDPFNQPKGRHEMLRAGIPGLPGRQPGEYLSDREADEAVGFIERHKDQPFFLQLANYAVHTPIQAKAGVTQKYQDKIKNSKVPLKQKNAKYAAMVESVDDAFGRIQATLEKFKLEERTLVIFTSDNGGLKGPTNNAPLRSGKGYAYEGGIRVPFLVKWPGVTSAGSVDDTPVTSIDLFPTILAAAGAPLPEDREIDGMNLRPLLSGTGEINREAIFWHFPHYRHAPGPYSIIRKGSWKLIKWYEGPRALFNLEMDLGEKNNLAEAQPGKVKALEQELMAHLKAIGAKIPVPKSDAVPVP
ncbi:MAG: sulfatase [Planctomycetota bacterium]|nr:sulfatase [Planctomycetota bacterium]